MCPRHVGSRGHTRSVLQLRREGSQEIEQTWRCQRVQQGVEGRRPGGQQVSCKRGIARRRCGLDPQAAQKAPLLRAAGGPAGGGTDGVCQLHCRKSQAACVVKSPISEPAGSCMQLSRMRSAAAESAAHSDLQAASHETMRHAATRYEHNRRLYIVWLPFATFGGRASAINCQQKGVATCPAKRDSVLATDTSAALAEGAPLTGSPERRFTCRSMHQTPLAGLQARRPPQAGVRREEHRRRGGSGHRIERRRHGC